MYLDTANVEEIKYFSDFKWITGVTTNPTLLKKIPHQNRETIIDNISALLDGRQLFVQISGQTSEELVKEADQLLGKYRGKISLKIAADKAGFEAIELIKKKYPRVIILATAIFSVEQAYLAAIAGCDWVAPYINRMENQSLDALEMVEKIATLYKKNSLRTRILGASFKNSGQVMNTLLAGADDVTVPAEILESMMANKLASDSITTFNEHAKEVANK